MTASATKCRDLGQFTYLGRVATFISLSDAHSIDLGASYAYMHRRSQAKKAHRHLAGLDITYRYVPPARPPTVVSSGVRSALQSREPSCWRLSDGSDDTITRSLRAQQCLGTVHVPGGAPEPPLLSGFLFDYAQALDAGVGDTKPTRRTSRSGSRSSSVWLQPLSPSRVPNSSQPMRTRSSCNGPVILGSHAHSFRDR